MGVQPNVDVMLERGRSLKRSLWARPSSPAILPLTCISSAFCVKPTISWLWRNIRMNGESPELAFTKEACFFQGSGRGYVFDVATRLNAKD
jgi:hypothetical protein